MKDDKKVFLIVSIIFSVLLAFVWAWGGGVLGIMFKNDWAFAVLSIASTVACIYSWYKALKNFEDPNYDYWRILILVFAIAAIVIVGAYNAQHNADAAAGIA